ncbi:MarR family winged helix-turn-helix transcriptional regulator [Paenibacillus sp. NPDC058071]|uniref:MarR family winged helix-turn-helix transcriptional regulator n=1 Tax=Paenibacillus sp. NPDC058071 TaxID=3346326 RepID=UPI0036DD2551
MIEEQEWKLDTMKLLEAFTLFHKQHWQYSSENGSRSELQALMCIKHMSVVRERVGVKVSELSKLLHVTSPTATQLINRLESAGAVERRPDPKDRRSVLLALTPEGERRAAHAAAMLKERLEGLAAYLGKQDTEHFTRLLLKTKTYFEQQGNRSERQEVEQTC